MAIPTIKPGKGIDIKLPPRQEETKEAPKINTNPIGNDLGKDKLGKR